MNVEISKLLILAGIFLVIGCSEETIDPGPGNVGPPLPISVDCKVDEIEFRNGDDEITSVREFNYNVNKKNRLESVTIVEGFDDVPITLGFQFKYLDDESVVPKSMDEVFGADVVTNTTFKFDSDGNISEYIRMMLTAPFNGLPESHLFYYEDSELANDSINARIVTFDIERLTIDWIDVLPALFTTGGKRINRVEEITFRGDLIRFCDLSYGENGYLDEIVCRTADGVLSEVWNFTYENGRLLSAFKQLPNFRAITTYDYDSKGKPTSVVSTTDGRFNWKAGYFYFCN